MNDRLYNRLERFAILFFLNITAALVLTLPASAALELISIQDINPDNSNLDPSVGSSGRINGLARAPGNDDVFYAASEWGGLYKTTNKGRKWFRLDRHLPTAMWDVEVDPTNAEKIYATSFYDGRSFPLSGIQVSLNGGESWVHPTTAIPPKNFCELDPAKDRNIDARDEPSAFGISIDPDNTRNVYIGTNCGLAISNDSGFSWRFVDPTPSPSNSANNIWDVVVHDNGIIDICGDDGHLRSIDDGNTWTGGGGVPKGRCSIAVSPHEADVLFIAANDEHAYESDDGGITWNNLGTPETTGTAHRIAFVETNARTGDAFDLWFGDVYLYRVGCQSNPVGGGLRCPLASATPPLPAWEYASSGAHVDVGSIVFEDSRVVQNACPLMFSNDGGVYYNTDVSASCQNPQWEQPDVSPHVLWVYGMGGADQPGDAEEDLYFGTQDNAIWGTTNAGQSPKPDWQAGHCCDVYDVATDGNSVLYTSNAGGLLLTDRHLAGNTNINPGHGAIDNSHFAQGVATWERNHFVVLTQDCDQDSTTHTLSPCPSGAMSEDGGVFITDDITANTITWTELGKTTKPPTDISEIDLLGEVQVAVDDSGTPTFYVLVGAFPGDKSRVAHRLWKFEGIDGTGNWERIDTNIPGGLDSGSVGIFAVAPSDPNRLYASYFDEVGVFRGMLFSNDGGTTWQRDRDLPRSEEMVGLDSRMTGKGIFKYQNFMGPNTFLGSSAFGGLAGYTQPTLIAFDPEDPNLIVAAGHDSGIFLSQDGGFHWDLLTDPFDSGISGVPHLPNPWFAYFDHEPAGIVNDKLVGRLNIYIGTLGRGVWRIVLTDTDLNADNCVDRLDLNLLLNVIRGRSEVDPGLEFDINGDGAVNIADARKLVTYFTNPRGARCQE
ncbi:WD40/YVTN/BNR-like repeat-containing protein [Desulfogranum mediterraneum]|uniref:WD40/YVTN/BNR-like repeat-containing protein n=1 Tax=Desulfogranum mediterraneum TaxID=160661 RepID=UPI00041E061A|nr:dockerin type I domain-containing protein [Desulfogranum mediterraneum]